jgi:hypothetical protein
MNVSSDLSFEVLQRQRRTNDTATPDLDVRVNPNTVGGQCWAVGMREARRLAEIASRKGATAEDLL